MVDFDLKEYLKKVRTYAESHPISTKENLEIASGNGPQIGDRKDHVMDILDPTAIKLIRGDTESGFKTIAFRLRVVFSIEETKDGRWARMMSFSSTHGYKSLSNKLIRKICKYLGYTNYTSPRVFQDPYYSNVLRIIEIF